MVVLQKIHRTGIEAALFDKSYYVCLDFWKLESIILKCIGVMKNIASPHNSNYVDFLYDQPKAFDFSAVLGSGGHDIDSGGVDAAVSQNIRQLRNVLLDAIKGSGKELAQIVGKNLGRIDAGYLA